MNKDLIFSVVKKHLRQAVDGLDETQIALDKSMKDLGANSLDIVEVVSATMRELKIKIPRAEMAKLTDIGGLVDLLHQVAIRPPAVDSNKTPSA